MLKSTTGHTYKVISGDSHTIEPPDLWSKWLEKKFQDRAPKLVKDEEGGDAWQYEAGGVAEPLGLVTRVGGTFEQLKWTGSKYGGNIHPGCHDGKERLKLLDIDGVDAEFLYPPQRAMNTFMRQTDQEAHVAGIRAYNRWLIEGFCSADPKRLFGVVQMPNLGVETMVSELKNARKQGVRGVVLSTWPSGGAAISRADDAFWAAAEETNTPVSIHISLANTGQPPRKSKIQEAGPAMGSTAFGNFMPIIVEMIFFGVFDRFPKLKIVGVEVGGGWVPHFLEMMDDRYWRNRNWAKTQLKKVPSQYWYDNFLATFIIDKIGVQIRHAVGLDNLAWSTDFPHHGNDFPYSRRTIDEHFINVPEEERYKIVCGNIGKTYGLLN
jgi:predicted TIM-barrel fold metal-dependent hydrolase